METLPLLVYLTGIMLSGFLAQWFSWKLGFPSIVFLFLTGLIFGPLTGILSPDALFGEDLFPVVSVLVGVILFEGGLTLELDDLGTLKITVLKIIFIGGLVTFILTGISAYYLFELSFGLSFLLGAILVVTGPTVVIPLLHQIRPNGDVGSIARWEGIIIDPLGAISAVIIFEIVLSGVNGTASGFGFGLLLFGQSLVVGGTIGFAGGYILVLCFQRYWIPDYLHNFAILAGVLTAQAVANQILHESGLLAVTVMGMYMANQKKVTIRHVLNFKEELRILFISILFIILVARLDSGFIFEIRKNELIFLGILIVLIRPVAIFLSTIGSELTWPERGFLAWIAPRGIVAAAIASLFAFELEKLEVTGAAHLADITFLVIAGTVLVYGLTLRPLSLLLGLSERDPQGVLFVGASGWVRKLAKVLKEQGMRIRLVDNNEDLVRQAKQSGLEAHTLDFSTESEIQSLNIQGIGYFLAVTPSDVLNTLACLHAMDLGFDRAEIFQLPPHEGFHQDEQQLDPLKGRLLFGKETHFEDIQDKLNRNWEITVVTVENQHEADGIISRIPERLVPLFKVSSDQLLEVVSGKDNIELIQGDRLVCFKEIDYGE